MSGTPLKPTIEQIAQVCHEALGGYQTSLHDETPTHYPYQHLPWLTASQESREGTIQGVKDVLAGMGPRECHENWVVHRQQLGWRYGSLKSEFSKTHPSMVPYHQLPEAQKMKNQIFASIVLAMVADMRVMNSVAPE